LVFIKDLRFAELWLQDHFFGEKGFDRGWARMGADAERPWLFRVFRA
jgi:hypothetical protein